MKGYPSSLNTKEDYLYVRANFPREQWLPDFQHLLDSRKDWFFVSHLPDKESGVTDDTHKVVESQDMDSDTVTYDQYELRDNPTAKIYRLGFTVEEVEELMK